MTYQLKHRGPCFVHNRAAKFDSPTTLQTMPSIVVVQQMQTPAASPQAEMVHMLPEIAHATVSAKKSNKMTSTKKKGAYCFWFLYDDGKMPLKVFFHLHWFYIYLWFVMDVYLFICASRMARYFPTTWFIEQRWNVSDMHLVSGSVVQSLVIVIL